MATLTRSEFKLDWLSIALFVLLMLFGWFNIYAASTNDTSLDLFNINYNYGKQFIYIVVCSLIGVLLLNFTNLRDIEFASYIIYGVTTLLLILVLFFGVEISGARSWFDLGPFRLQPSEFAKLGTILGLAKYMSQPNFRFDRVKDQLVVFGMMTTPAILIILQGDTGTAIVFAGLVLMMFREGLSPFYLILGTLVIAFGVLTFIIDRFTAVNLIFLLVFGAYIYMSKHKRWAWHLFLLLALNLALLSFFRLADVGFTFADQQITGQFFVIALDIVLILGFLLYMLIIRNSGWLMYTVMGAGLSAMVFSIDWIVMNLLPDHQRARIIGLFNPEYDPTGVNWNTMQSKIAIGSGGLTGKGYLEGTQTKFDFVPQQHTDFIFCTIGEEWGWIGSVVLLALFGIFLWQLVMMAEDCKSHFGRIVGYSVASFFFIHIAINIGMTIGLAPVIGIPLPFFSYGGSSLLGFTLMFFLVQKFYAERFNVLG
jgi:rod shape determining protein RodA